MKKVLFQGDSITDMMRSRENDKFMGIGYPVLVSAQLGAEYPGEYEFLNRGYSMLIGEIKTACFAKYENYDSGAICVKGKRYGKGLGIFQHRGGQKRRKGEGNCTGI